MNPERIGKFIYQLRTEKGLSQYQLADMIPISRQAVSKWERAQTIPDSSTLIRLSEIFEVSINELLKGEHLEQKTMKQLEQITLDIVDENNEKTRLNKRIHKASILMISTLIFLFLIYYFITTYNTIKVYTVGAIGDKFILNEGIFISTKYKTYMKLGKVISSANQEIKNVKVYYQKNAKQRIIFEDKEVDKTIMDLYGYEENFPQKDIKDILQHSYIEITYDEDKKEVVSLVFERDFTNKSYFFIKKSPAGTTDDDSSKENLMEEDLVKTIKEKGELSGTDYIYKTKEKDIKFSYSLELQQIIISQKDEILGMILLENHIYSCQEIQNEKNCKKEIKNLIEKYLQDSE
ncbi:MAG: helix-turn-helix transcriptional regulator [Bacilli bacterium]|nr:helix-turn-helix transcriptional regulator [Bacilli bacterium]